MRFIMLMLGVPFILLLFLYFIIVYLYLILRAKLIVLSFIFPGAKYFIILLLKFIEFIHEIIAFGDPQIDWFPMILTPLTIGLLILNLIVLPFSILFICGFWWWSFVLVWKTISAAAGSTFTTGAPTCWASAVADSALFTFAIFCETTPIIFGIKQLKSTFFGFNTIKKSQLLTLFASISIFLLYLHLLILKNRFFHLFLRHFWYSLTIGTIILWLFLLILCINIKRIENILE